MSAKEYIESFGDGMGFFNPDLRCQAYIIALGVNDVNSMLNDAYEMGTVEDINKDNYAVNKPTFAGWYGAIISKYKEIQPHARFFLMTMPHGKEVEKRAELYDRHAELINEIAEKFSNCYVLDFRKYAPVYDDIFRKTFFTGGHMNVMGYRLTATMVESYIDYIIRNNSDAFNQSGFIGKMHYNAE